MGVPPLGTIAPVLDTTKGTSAADGAEAPPPTDPGQAIGGGRGIDTGGRSLRAHTARGVMVNGVFDVGLSSLSLIRGFILAAFLTTADYGVWGVLLVSLGVLSQLKLVGIGDKYVQQEEPDQEAAFQKAFTLELLMTAATIVPMIAALPVIAIVYGHWKLVPPGLVLISTLVAYALQAPFWVYYRNMNFLKQRRLMAIEPIVGFVLAIGLAIAGLGYWAIAIGLAWAPRRGRSRRSAPPRSACGGATTAAPCACTRPIPARCSLPRPRTWCSPTR